MYTEKLILEYGFLNFQEIINESILDSYKQYGEEILEELNKYSNMLIRKKVDLKFEQSLSIKLYDIFESNSLFYGSLFESINDTAEQTFTRNRIKNGHEFSDSLTSPRQENIKPVYAKNNYIPSEKQTTFSGDDIQNQQERSNNHNMKLNGANFLSRIRRTVSDYMGRKEPVNPNSAEAINNASNAAPKLDLTRKPVEDNSSFNNPEWKEQTEKARSYNLAKRDNKLKIDSSTLQNSRSFGDMIKTGIQNTRRFVGKPIARLGRNLINAGAMRTGHAVAQFGRKIAIGGPFKK